jgi:hypothetical protein
MAREWAERQLVAFASASKIMAVVAALLEVLPTPSTDGAGEVYQQLKSILGTTTMQQAESSLLHWDEASIFAPHQPQRWGTEGHPRSSRRGNIILISTLFDLRPPRLIVSPRGNDAWSQQHAWNPCHGGYDDHKGHSPSPEG